jgi:hypothetical protein
MEQGGCQILFFQWAVLIKPMALSFSVHLGVERLYAIQPPDACIALGHVLPSSQRIDFGEGYQFL